MAEIVSCHSTATHHSFSSFLLDAFGRAGRLCPRCCAWCWLMGTLEVWRRLWAPWWGWWHLGGGRRTWGAGRSGEGKAVPARMGATTGWKLVPCPQQRGSLGRVTSGCTGGAEGKAHARLQSPNKAAVFSALRCSCYFSSSNNFLYFDFTGLEVPRTKELRTRQTR